MAEHGLKLLQLGNPWNAARSDWLGLFCQGDPRIAEYKGLDEVLVFKKGTFWLRLEDFVANFNSLYICE